MNSITVKVGYESLIEEADKEYDVVVVTPNSSDLGAGQYELLIMDTRSKNEIRLAFRNIYKPYAQNNKT